MGQCCAVVLEQFIPELSAPGVVVDQGAADIDHHPEQLRLVPRRPLTTAHNRPKTVKRVYVAEVYIAFPQRISRGGVRKVQMKQQRNHQVFKDADGDTVDLYDAQLYLLVGVRPAADIFTV